MKTPRPDETAADVKSSQRDARSGSLQRMVRRCVDLLTHVSGGNLGRSVPSRLERRPSRPSKATRLWRWLAHPVEEQHEWTLLHEALRGFPSTCRGLSQFLFVAAREARNHLGAWGAAKLLWSLIGVGLRPRLRSILLPMIPIRFVPATASRDVWRILARSVPEYYAKLAENTPPELANQSRQTAISEQVEGGLRIPSFAHSPTFAPRLKAGNRMVYAALVVTPNDPKLSDGGGWRGPCMAGGKAAAEARGVTAVAVRCSAWLGVAVIGKRASVLSARKDSRQTHGRRCACRLVGVALAGRLPCRRESVLRDVAGLCCR